jgi:hypothetical protein
MNSLVCAIMQQCHVCGSTSLSLTEIGQLACDDCGTQLFAISQLEQAESDLAHIAKIGGRLMRMSRRRGKLLRSRDGEYVDPAEDVLAALLLQYQGLLRYMVHCMLSEFGCPVELEATVRLLWRQYLHLWYVSPASLPTTTCCVSMPRVLCCGSREGWSHRL